MTDKPLTARIEVFRPGTFTPMKGEPITYSAADLKAIADAYDPATAPAPIVVGHPETDAPAFGWVERFEYDGQSERLVAHVGEIEPAFAELVKAGRFKKISMAFFSPRQGHNPVPGTWYPKHVGFLGATAPAVSGLQNASFAEPAGAIFTAEFGAGQEAASIFRALRDFFIDRFGIEDADKALPAWQIEWLETSDEAKPHYSTPSFSQARSFASGGIVSGRDQDLIGARPNPQKKEPAVTTPPDPAHAQREAEFAAREKRLADRERAAAHDDNVSFAESLVQDGRLLPASKDKVVSILDALPSEASVSFAEGAEKVTPAAAVREVLAAQPKVVSFGSQDLGDDPAGGRAAAFAADGREVDTAGLQQHQRAVEYQRKNPGTPYIQAVKAVS